jgi:Protein of unknown function (DUF3105)
LPEAKAQVTSLSVENQTSELGANPGAKKRAVIVVFVSLTLLMAACGGRASDNATGDSEKQDTSSGTPGRNATSSAGETTVEETTGAVSGEAAELARAHIGKREITNMLPADGKKPDAPQPLPKNPPKGIEVYPATTSRVVEGPIQYDRHPPTNGDHAPLWQNCGFYSKPIEDRHAVHSLDHGVVWITYLPDLPQRQIEALRPYGNENYVIVSPYPGQDAPVIATSWRVQLKLKSANDPRLKRFVNEFKISELAPLSGNRCILGIGNPKS